MNMIPLSFVFFSSCWASS